MSKPTLLEWLGVLRIGALAWAGIVYLQMIIAPSSVDPSNMWPFTVGTGGYMVGYGFMACNVYPLLIRVSGALVVAVVNGAGATLLAWFAAGSQGWLPIDALPLVSVLVCGIYATFFIPPWLGLDSSSNDSRAEI